MTPARRSKGKGVVGYTSRPDVGEVRRAAYAAARRARYEQALQSNPRLVKSYMTNLVNNTKRLFSRRSEG